MVLMNVGWLGSGSILPRSVVMQRSTLREVTMTLSPQTVSMMSLRVSARPGLVTKYFSMRNSFDVSSQLLHQEASLRRGNCCIVIVGQTFCEPLRSKAYQTVIGGIRRLNREQFGVCDNQSSLRVFGAVVLRLSKIFDK
jgi:hypothetical protein